MQCQYFFYRQRIIRINFDFSVIVRKNIYDTIFYSYEAYNSIVNGITSLINPSILSNLIRKGFAPIKVFYEMSSIKIFLCDFSSIKLLSKSKSSNLIISSK